MKSVNWKVENGVCELALSFEPCNEIGTEILGQLEEFLEQLDLEKTRVLLIYSKLDRGFCAGANLRELYERIKEREGDQYEADLRSFIDRIHMVMDRLDTLPITTIGVINGLCFGGGFELALTCDLLVAEESARFCFPELRLGIIPGFGGIPRLKRDLGNGMVRDLLLTGRSINAKKAQAVGLVSQVVGKGHGLSVARKMAVQSAKYDRHATKQCKAFMKELPKDELAREKELFLDLFQRPVVVEALKKFVESTDIRPYLA